MSIRKLLMSAGLALGLASTALASPALAEDAQLPGSMVWTAYDVGSSGYVEASAAADAMIKKYGVRVRILPSGTSVGRLLPLKAGRADVGWLANEVYFATEAVHDFATRDWGPQDLRIGLGRPGPFGFAVAADAGVEKIADLRGKRVPFIKANPSINTKVEAMLAFGGLTWDDVQVVEVPSYGAALRAVVDGLADAAGTVPTAAAMYELESSKRGLIWPDLPVDDKDGWDAVQSVAPFFAPATFTEGAGLSKDKPAHLMAYRYPMLTFYAGADEDFVYNIVKAMDETYGLYKDGSAAMVAWEIAKAGRTPADAPFHPGAVRYLKEIGVWTAEDQAWNDKREARMAAVRKAWEAAVKAAEAKGVSDDEWPAFWADWRKANLS